MFQSVMIVVVSQFMFQSAVDCSGDCLVIVDCSD